MEFHHSLCQQCGRRGVQSLMGLVIPGVVAGCGGGETAQPASVSTSASEEVLRAEVLTVRAAVWPRTVRTQGSLFADEVAVIGAKIAGRVDEAHVDLGDSVSEGSPLVTLDQEEFRLRVAQAEAQLQQARAAVGLTPGAALESLVPENAAPVREARAVWDEARSRNQRAIDLRNENVMTAQELEEIVAAEKVAASRYASAVNGVNEKIALVHVRTAELDLAKQQLDDTVIKSPFSGQIEERHVAPGSFVQVGQAIVTLVRDNPIHFRGRIPERFAQELRKGQEVRLRLESLAEPRLAVVTRIHPSLDPLSRSLLFEAELGNESQELRAGLFAEAEVTIDTESETIVVPESAVLVFAGVEKVWKVIDGTLKEQIVLTGERREDKVEIVSGVTSGDVLLMDAQQGRPGPVEALHDEPEPEEADSADRESDSSSEESESDELSGTQ